MKSDCGEPDLQIQFSSTHTSSGSVQSEMSVCQTIVHLAVIHRYNIITTLNTADQENLLTACLCRFADLNGRSV